MRGLREILIAFLKMVKHFFEQLKLAEYVQIHRNN